MNLKMKDFGDGNRNMKMISKKRKDQVFFYKVKC